MTDFASAEAEIRQLYARYTDAVWRKDFDTLGDFYTEDAEWRIGGKILTGRAAIVEQCRNVFALFRRILFTPRTPLIELGNGAAEVRTYVTEQSSFTDGRGFAPIGIYFDRLVRQPDRWRFSWRLFQTQYVGGPELDGTFFDTTDFGPPPAMPALDAETVDRTGMHTKN